MVFMSTRSFIVSFELSRRATCATMASMICLSPVAAQQSSSPDGGVQAPQQPGWAVQCTSATRSEPLACSMEQRIVLRETGQQLARLSIQVAGSEPRTPALLIHLPLGLSIPAGVRLQVDDNDASTMDIQTCEAAGCYAGGPLSEALLASFRQGQQVKVTFRNLQAKDITVGFALAGFDKVYATIQ